MHADEGLEQIRALVLRMGVRAESMARLASRGVTERDLVLARSVAIADAELDHLETGVDRMVVERLARFSASGDALRFLVCSLKVVTEIERIGDHSVNLADRAIDLGTGPGLEPGLEFPVMAQVTVGMIRQAVTAFGVRDVATARAVIERDEEIDHLHRAALDRLAAAASGAPGQVERAFLLSSALRQLQRMADHAVRVAQLVVLMVDDQDVRHRRLVA
jgi:phosphate transport system protein